MKRIVLFDSNTAYVAPPYALLAITTLLDTRKFDMRIVTKREYPDYEKEILDLCDGALCFGLTCITGMWIKTALRVSRLVRAQYPNLPIIWGGWQCTTLPDLTLQEPSVDYICSGQGERTFAEFIDALQNGDMDRLRAIPGLSYKRDGKNVHNLRREPEDINNFPDFDLNLINWEKHVEASGFGKRQLRILTSFGCPYRCGFCSEENSCKRKWKALTPERVLAFLEKLRDKVSLDTVLITDNNFFVSEKRVEGICRGLLDHGFRLSLVGVAARTSELTRYKESTWELLRQTGLKNIMVGAESANNETLALITKDATVEQTLELCRLCHRHGVKPLLCFVMGFPIEAYFKENQEDVLNREFKEVYDFFKKVYFEVTANFEIFLFYYIPLPSSRLFDTAVARGFVPPTTLEGWGEYQFWEIRVPWLPRHVAEGMKIRVFKYMALVLGQNYDTYVSHLPAVFRIIGLSVVNLARYLARQRLKYDYLGLPLDMYAFLFAERLFRKINKIKRMVNICD